MMKKKQKWLLYVGLLTVVFLWGSALYAFAQAQEEPALQPALYATFWSLVPPVVAIVLALITKEVYSSLVIGIIVGGLLASGGQFEGTLTTVISSGIMEVLSSRYNVGILIFLVILGMIVALMNKTGGSEAFGNWASKRIKTRLGAQLATILLDASSLLTII